MGLRKMSNIMNLSNLCTIHLKEILRKMSCKTFRMLWVIQDYYYASGTMYLSVTTFGFENDL